MIGPERTLAEVAAIISARLAHAGIEICVVGGSAITVHEPDVYVSHDIDLAILTGIERRKIELGLRALGYARRGRIFVHPESQWTVDIVADTPYIADRPITAFATIETPYGSVRSYHLEDAIADRIAAFLFWNDSQSLAIAERLAARRASDVRWPVVVASLEPLHGGDPASTQRLSFALQRLRRALESGDAPKPLDGDAG